MTYSQIGQAAGVTVVLDCGGAEADISPDLLQHLTIISPNESELANLTGMNPHSCIDNSTQLPRWVLLMVFVCSTVCCS